MLLFWQVYSLERIRSRSNEQKTTSSVLHWNSNMPGSGNHRFVALRLFVELGGYLMQTYTSNCAREAGAKPEEHGDAGARCARGGATYQRRAIWWGSLRKPSHSQVDFKTSFLFFFAVPFYVLPSACQTGRQSSVKPRSHVSTFLSLACARLSPTLSPRTLSLGLASTASSNRNNNNRHYISETKKKAETIPK